MDETRKAELLRQAKANRAKRVSAPSAEIAQKNQPAKVTPKQPAKSNQRNFEFPKETGWTQFWINLGVMYGKGQGVPQDDAEAVKLIRLAADQGLALAQNNLGVMYRDGQGVPQDDAEAYVWFFVAAAGGYAAAANNRDFAAGELTPEQLSQGQKRATEVFEKISSGK